LTVFALQAVRRLSSATIAATIPHSPTPPLSPSERRRGGVGEGTRG
jgi:hypothetical protein